MFWIVLCLGCRTNSTRSLAAAAGEGEEEAPSARHFLMSTARRSLDEAFGGSAWDRIYAVYAAWGLRQCVRFEAALHPCNAISGKPSDSEKKSGGKEKKKKKEKEPPKKKDKSKKKKKRGPASLLQTATVADL